MEKASVNASTPGMGAPPLRLCLRRDEGLGLRVMGAGFRAEGAWIREYGAGFRAQRLGVGWLRCLGVMG